ncbi:MULTISPECIES: hypothetical protein [unclassified Modestobacter]
MTETSDPIDPEGPDEPRVTLGGREEPATGDPTAGGKRGEIGEVPSIAADEPDDGSTYPVGGGDISAEPQQPPHADPGPDGTP